MNNILEDTVKIWIEIYTQPNSFMIIGIFFRYTREAHWSIYMWIHDFKNKSMKFSKDIYDELLLFRLNYINKYYAHV